MIRPGPADKIVALARHGFELVHDAADEAWAIAGTQAFRIGSPELNDRLLVMAFEEDLKAPSNSTLTTAANMLAAIARLEGPERTVGLRLAAHEGRVVYDLADDEGWVVVVTPGGWEITTDSPVPFYRPAGALSQVMPEHGGSLDGLAELLALDADDVPLVIGSLFGCFNPSGPKPLLELVGVQGSGKSMRARMLRALFDPCASPLQTMPGDVRNLAVLASRRALLAFDNVSRITDELSDALCRLATGGGFDTRRLYTDDGLITFDATRPVIVTGIPDAVRSADLVDRTVRIVLTEMGEGDRLTEAEVWRRFEEIRPQVLGVLLDAVAWALRNRDRVVLRQSPRMLDFATFVEAGAPRFGWAPETFLDAYIANGKAASQTVIDSSYIGQFIPELAESGFSNTFARALRELALIAGPDAVRHRAWPGSPSGLEGILRRLKPPLADQGIVVEFLPPRMPGGHATVRINKAPAPDADSGAVLSLTRANISSTEYDRVVSALRALGVDASWSSTKAAPLAMLKTAGDAALAAEALNTLGVPAPSGGTWTPSELLAVI